jgi:O-antigen/teichoic acid export membrane protein
LKKDFKTNLIKLSSGPIIGQLISLLSAPLIARFYGAESFGVALIFGSFSSILIPFINARYDIAVVMAPNKIDAASLATLACIISTLISFFILILTFFLGDYLFTIFELKSLLNLKWFISVSVFLGGIINVLNVWCTRQKYFLLISKAQIITQLFVTMSGISFGISGFNSPIILILSSIFGQFIMLIILLVKVIIEDKKVLIKDVKFIKLKELAIRYIDFPKFSSVAAIFNTFSWQVPIMLLSFFFTPKIVGYYGLGFRLIQAPMSLVGNALNQVFFQFGSENRFKGKLSESVESLFNWIFSIVFLPCIVLLFSGADLFNLFFGDTWREAGVYVQLLIPWALIWFISSPLSPIYSITERQKDEVKVHFLILVLRITSLLVGGMLGSPRLAILLFSVGGFISYSFLLKQIFKYSGVQLSNFLPNIKKVVLFGIILCIPLIFATLFNINIYLIAFLSISTLFIHLFLILKKNKNV